MSLLYIINLTIYNNSFQYLASELHFNDNTNLTEDKKIYSMNSVFYVNYVESANKDASNPYFPAIHIQTDVFHSGWLQVVRTNTELKCFIDTYPEGYPFYTLDQDFYDAPLWTYVLLWHKSMLWEGHAYAVKVDDKEKTIMCFGGIGWGFGLKWYALYPEMIKPFSLGNDEWKKDWEVLKDGFKNYKIILNKFFEIGSKLLDEVYS